MPKQKNELTKATKLADLLDGKEIKQDFGVSEPEETDIYSGLTERQKVIQRLALRRLTQRAIATALNVSPATVNVELAAIRQHHIARGTTANRAEIIGEALTVYDEVEKYAWDTFHNAKPENPLRLKALEMVMKARGESLKIQGNLGLLAHTEADAVDSAAGAALLAKFEGTIRSLLVEQIAKTHLAPSTLEDPTPPGMDSESVPTIDLTALEDPTPPEEP